MGNNDLFAGAVGGESDGSALLTQSDERFQTVTINKTRIILSVLDDYQLGGGNPPLNDFSDKLINCIYADQITFCSSLKFKNALISANTLSNSNDQDALSIDVSGTKGVPANVPNTNPNVTPMQAASGDPGYKLWIYVEDVPATAPNISVLASGGAGAPGQDGTDSADAGSGGDGGDGGHVAMVISHPYKRIISDLLLISKETDQDSKIEKIKQLLEMQANALVLPNLVAAIKNQTAPDPINDAIRQDGNKLMGLVQAWIQAFKSKINTLGGTYGVHGVGKKNGKNGVSGNDGSVTIDLFGAPEELVKVPLIDTFTWIHPAQCEMALQKAKLMYMAADPTTKPESVQDTIILLRRIQSRTDVFNSIKDDDPIAVAMKEAEADIGAIASLTTLKGIYNEATHYLSQIKKGLNIFGRSFQDVPRSSLDFYQTNLATLISNFHTIEASYNSHFEQLAANDHSTAAISAAREKTQSTLDADNNALDMLRANCTTTARAIDSFQLTLPAKKKAVEWQLDQFSKDIAQAFPDFNFSDYVHGMAMVAMGPETAFNWVSQGQEMMINASTRLTDDMGEKVQREYLIDKIKKVEASFDKIAEGYATRADGFLEADDPSGSKLFAVEQQVLSMLDTLSNQFPNQLAGLKKAFDSYIQDILARNRLIISYNATLDVLLRTRKEIAELQAKKDELTEKALGLMQGNWPALTAFASRLYYFSRNQILDMLDQTSRAYRFWALADDDPMANFLSNTLPPKIDAAALVGAQSTIVEAYANAVNKFGVDALLFPQNEGDEGVIVQLSEAEIELLKLNNEILINIPVARVATNKKESAFSGKANVRLHSVRLWLTGVTTSDQRIHIDITHTGHEQIVDPLDKVFSFKHDPVTVSFEYLLSTNKIIEDAVFWPYNQSKVSNYAMVGPFTYWHLRVKPEYNSDLDLTNLTEAKLEFHGTNFSFR